MRLPLLVPIIAAMPLVLAVPAAHAAAPLQRLSAPSILVQGGTVNSNRNVPVGVQLTCDAGSVTTHAAYTITYEFEREGGAIIQSGPSNQYTTTETDRGQIVGCAVQLIDDSDGSILNETQLTATSSVVEIVRVDSDVHVEYGTTQATNLTRAYGLESGDQLTCNPGNLSELQRGYVYAYYWYGTAGGSPFDFPPTNLNPDTTTPVFVVPDPAEDVYNCEILVLDAGTGDPANPGGGYYVQLHAATSDSRTGVFNPTWNGYFLGGDVPNGATLTCSPGIERGAVDYGDYEYSTGGTFQPFLTPQITYPAGGSEPCITRLIDIGGQGRAPDYNVVSHTIDFAFIQDVNGSDSAFQYGHTLSCQLSSYGTVNPDRVSDITYTFRDALTGEIVGSNQTLDTSDASLQGRSFTCAAAVTIDDETQLATQQSNPFRVYALAFTPAIAASPTMGTEPVANVQLRCDLGADLSSLTNASIAYAWLLDGQIVSTEQTYQLSEAQVGHTIACRIHLTSDQLNLTVTTQAFVIRTAQPAPQPTPSPQPAPVTPAPQPTPACAPTNDLIIGTAGDDVLCGGAGNDIIYGGGGNDRITGGGGDDVIYGDGGNDTIDAGAGNDTVHGGAGNDVIAAGAGNDVVYGGAGYDVISTGDGSNTVYAGSGGSRITGGAHADRIIGGSGVDIVRAGAGNDWVATGSGNDRINAGAGIDVVFSGSGNDVIRGGAGDDVLYGLEGNDVIYSGAGGDKLYGGLGNDRLYGEAGLDILYGGLGSDRLVGGAGRDVLWGNSGRDVLFIDAFDLVLPSSGDRIVH